MRLGRASRGEERRRLHQLEPQPDPCGDQRERLEQRQPPVAGQRVDAGGDAPEHHHGHVEDEKADARVDSGCRRRAAATRSANSRGSRTATPSPSVPPAVGAARPRRRQGAPSTTSAGTPMASSANCRPSTTSTRRAWLDSGGTSAATRTRRAQQSPVPGGLRSDGPSGSSGRLGGARAGVGGRCSAAHPVTGSDDVGKSPTDTRRQVSPWEWRT